MNNRETEQRKATQCQATFDERFKTFYRRHGDLPELAKRLEQSVRLVCFWDGTSGNCDVLVEFDDRWRHIVKRRDLSIGKGIRSVPILRFHWGNTSLMGRVVKAMKSGRAFRGR